MNVFSACAKFLLLLFSPVALWAAEATTPVLQPAHYGARVVFFLLIVVTLIIGLAWLLHRTRMVSGFSNNGQGALKVVATLPLGMKEKVAVIQVGEQQIVVGITAQNMTLLTELEQPLPVPEQSTVTFAELLKKAIRS